VAGDGGDEEVFHQPAIVRVTVSNFGELRQ
jgi:hypothetical protein